MKKLIFLMFFSLCSLPGFAQVDYAQEEGFLIGDLEINPSLSFLSPPIPRGNFSLPEVDIFKKEEKRELDMVAMMEKERNYQTRSVDLSSHLPKAAPAEKTGVYFSNTRNFHDRDDNYDYFTGKTKNAAYREMRAGLFRGVYSPFVGGRYTRPYSSSPFFR